ncbi:hypothetical protein [Maribacter spongiicola]|uniref:hypothetical protein n=1 Tax=Maribacter spongiicola TaxID=1206753 RepID=UPI003F9B972B
MEWISPKHHTFFPLEGKAHHQVLDWPISTADAFLGKKYTYDFHYDLPYSIDDSFTFKLDASKLKELADLRTLTQSSLEKTLKETGLESVIRVWPHHFDSGAYANLTDTIAVGFGLAIPDDIVKKYYFYVRGYKRNDVIDTSKFYLLSIGEWKNDGFKGAILPASKVK